MSVFLFEICKKKNRASEALKSISFEFDGLIFDVFLYFLQIIALFALIALMICVQAAPQFGLGGFPFGGLGGGYNQGFGSGLGGG